MARTAGGTTTGGGGADWRAQLPPALQAAPAEAAAAALAARLREAEAALAASGAYLSVFERYPRPMVLVGADGRVSAFNRAAGEWVPNLREAQTVMAALGSYALDAAYQEARRTGRPVEQRVRLYLPDRRDMRARLEPSADEVYLFLEDESDAIDYQALRSQFAAVVSHELRTPVAGIQSLAEAIADAEDDAPARRAFVERLELESGRLARLVEEILFLSRLESGQEPPGDGCDLADAVHEAMASVRPTADRFHARLIDDATAGMPVRPNQRLAAICVRNLAENAIKYGGAGVTVTVATVVDPDERTAVLTVADDGPGIGRRHLPHLFERFYRVDASRSKLLGGTGLGLAIVKHIANAYGGEATVDSQEGFGSTFRVTLPLAPEPPGGRILR